MLAVQESSLVHFDKVKSFFADKRNVKKISTINFTINENEITQYLNEFVDMRPNLYALLIKRQEDELWSLKYIGQRESKGIKQRLREHLIKCNTQTGSQLEKIKSALSNGYEIGIKLVAILPDSNGQEHFRLLYESMLIKEFKDVLEWNIQK